MARIVYSLRTSYADIRKMARQRRRYNRYQTLLQKQEAERKAKEAEKLKAGVEAKPRNWANRLLGLE